MVTIIKERVLKPEAEEARYFFEHEYNGEGCTCFISPPCGYCLHPGNPRNQDEDDNCWDVIEREATPQEIKVQVTKEQWGEWS